MAAHAHTEEVISNTRSLLAKLLLPSWLSGLGMFVFSIAIVGTTTVLTREGSTVQQSLLGLRDVYALSPIGMTAQTVTDNFATNIYLNNVILFVLWGTAGLMVYSILQSALNKVREANYLIHELKFININRGSLVREVATHAFVRLAALTLWWLSLRLVVFKILPYAIAVTHTSALRGANMHSFLEIIIAALLCILSLYVLVVLLRLAMLRVRVFGGDIIE